MTDELVGHAAALPTTHATPTPTPILAPPICDSDRLAVTQTAAQGHALLSGLAHAGQCGTAPPPPRRWGYLQAGRRGAARRVCRAARQSACRTSAQTPHWVAAALLPLSFDSWIESRPTRRPASG